MKVCKFCGVENSDEARECFVCGKTQFNYKCSKCGTVYENGAHCPNCGTKTGQKAKKCLCCETEYFGDSCPNCGYEDYTTESAPNYTQNYTQNYAPPKKRKTWLWVLGWIFIYPVPLTILMLRSQKLSTGAKTGIIIAAWLIYFLIGVNGKR